MKREYGIPMFERRLVSEDLAPYKVLQNQKKNSWGKFIAVVVPIGERIRKRRVSFDICLKWQMA